jgi:hypothetical protein
LLPPRARGDREADDGRLRPVSAPASSREQAVLEALGRARLLPAVTVGGAALVAAPCARPPEAAAAG